MLLTIYTDGGSRNNPGNAAAAFVVYHNNKLLTQSSRKIGIATNNVAEYTALIDALSYVKTVDHSLFDEVRCFSDSQLMVSQLNGVYKIKDSSLKNLAEQVKKIAALLGKTVRYIYVPREQNQLADSLVKKELA